LIVNSACLVHNGAHNTARGTTVAVVADFTLLWWIYTKPYSQ
jgi:hypothetical protein